jgi:hypothetical protein
VNSLNRSVGTAVPVGRSNTNSVFWGRYARAPNVCFRPIADIRIQAAGAGGCWEERLKRVAKPKPVQPAKS